MNLSVSTEEIRWLEKNFLHLKFYTGNPPVIKGSLAFEWKYQNVRDKGNFPKIKDVYEVEIQLTTNLLSSLPQVRETGNRIPASADFHVNPDKTLCLCPYPEEKRRLSNGFNLKDYFNNLLIPFFYAQSYYEKNKEWAWGEYSHGELGLLEYYIENRNNGMNTKLIEDCVENFKKIMFGNSYPLLFKKDKIKGHILCFCNSNKKIRNCHKSSFQGLWHLREDLRKNNIKF